MYLVVIDIEHGIVVPRLNFFATVCRALISLLDVSATNHLIPPCELRMIQMISAVIELGDAP